MVSENKNTTIMKKIFLIILIVGITVIQNTAQNFSVELISIDSSNYSKKTQEKYTRLLNAKGEDVGKFTNGRYLYDNKISKTNVIWKNGDTIELGYPGMVNVTSDNEFLFNWGFVMEGYTKWKEPIYKYYLYIYNKKGDLIRDLSSYFNSSSVASPILSENGYFAISTKFKNDSSKSNCRLLVFDTTGNIVLNKLFYEKYEKITNIQISTKGNYIALKFRYNNNWLIIDIEGNVLHTVNNFVSFTPDEKYMISNRKTGSVFFNIYNKNIYWISPYKISHHSFIKNKCLIISLNVKSDSNYLEYWQIGVIDYSKKQIYNNVFYYNYDNLFLIRPEIYLQNENLEIVFDKTVIFKFSINFDNE